MRQYFGPNVTGGFQTRFLYSLICQCSSESSFHSIISCVNLLSVSSSEFEEHEDTWDVDDGELVSAYVGNGEALSALVEEGELGSACICLDISKKQIKNKSSCIHWHRHVVNNLKYKNGWSNWVITD